MFVNLRFGGLTMNKLVSLLVFGFAAVGLMFHSVATANTLEISRVTGTHDGGGGEFKIKITSGDVLNAPLGVPALANYPGTFQSFCVEKNELINAPTVPWSGGTSVGTFNYRVNTGAIGGGINTGPPDPSDFDPLDDRTAYLFTKFMNGTLSGYDLLSGANAHPDRKKDALALQQAIWAIEGEQSPLSLSGQAKTWYDDADDAVNGPNPTWSGLGAVRVLNVFTGSGSQEKHLRQDQLVLVPTPAAALAGMPLLGLLFAGHVVRRRLRRD
jgi:hypothetical protein